VGVAFAGRVGVAVEVVFGEIVGGLSADFFQTYWVGE